ncbi:MULTISPECIES: Dps family protein [Acetobacter]|uniref:DNA starvation/stationary phase protection protein n=2 Tax=Acetobacter TaxID=434 RepID=A0A5B9GG33_9PROT|nr:MULTISPECIES: DNA starvation/stationary phase protection protein [Acetobacter]ARW47129.1 DNA protection during starvation protein [Acetobacter pasteurianus subsp. pasteurianus]MCP1201898.1 DNA starvation/stationary phase protection protein [Acetobacter oryzoeni]QEE84607.1 DNA starvation/stationary phase protection protein [Acetobacter oryzoeni]GBR60929.1 transcriptional regulator starvation/low temperature inducible DNA-binding protein [Acetobacter senegalensis DSM 18889]
MSTTTAKAATAKEAHIKEYLGTPTDLKADKVKAVAGGLSEVLADVFALYIKTKNFHWHMSGRHFRDYHLLLDEQSQQIFAMTDPMAERARKIGGTTLHSVGEIARKTKISDNDALYVTPEDMLSELREDNLTLTKRLRAVHAIASDAGDVATTSLLETWIDETERRTWFLFESTRPVFGHNE